MEHQEGKNNKGSAIGKVKKLQKQYNKILVDLFDQFAGESIEAALEQNEGTFGENIDSIVQQALDNLKTHVLSELGVESSSACSAVVTMTDFEGAAQTPSFEVEPSESEEEESEEEESEEEEPEEEESEDIKEEGKVPPQLAPYIKKKKDESADEDEDDDENEDEKPMNESVSRDKLLSKSRRGDQSMLTEVYASMYKEVL